MAESLQQIISQVKEEGEKTRRHSDVVAESLKHEIQLVADGVSSVDERASEIQKDVSSITETVEVVQVDVATIKMDIEFIKNEMAQKINRQEFAGLEKRVSMLENKFVRAN